MNGPTLDFGCGTGCLTMALRDSGLGGKVTAVDTSRAMLEQLDIKAKGGGVTTVAIEARGHFETRYKIKFLQGCA